MPELYYPGADKYTQNFHDEYPGVKITPGVVVLHTTETMGFPRYGKAGYADGYSAPHFTGRVNYVTKKIDWRQHHPINRSSRALKNLAGGIETNNNKNGTIQIELCGTSGWAATRGIIPDWSDEPDEWMLDEVAKLLAWLNKEWGIRLVATTRPFKHWFETSSKMGPVEWGNFRGICGHQHVPENTHTDPGKINIAKLISLAISHTEPVEEVPPVEVPVYQNPYPISSSIFGEWTRQTTRALQYFLNRTVTSSKLIIDGIYGELTKKTLQRWLGVTVDGVVGPVTITALQKKVGVPAGDVDGILGPQTIEYMQKYLNEKNSISGVSGL